MAKQIISFNQFEFKIFTNPDLDKMDNHGLYSRDLFITLSVKFDVIWCPYWVYETYFKKTDHVRPLVGGRDH